MRSLSKLCILLPLVSGAVLDKRVADETERLCGQYDSLTTTSDNGQYSLFTNNWGRSDASYGYQCSQITSLKGSFISWNTDWQWSGGTQIKSFSNVQLNTGIDQQLSAISSMPSTWHWRQHSSGTVVADVAYDMFTSTSPGGSSVNEVMVWLANYNAGPISYSYSDVAEPIVSNIHLAGYTWNLYSGWNQHNVYSFLPTKGNIAKFSGDVYSFFEYLIDHNYLGNSQYLTIAQAGTEATSGAATLTTTAYSLSINKKYASKPRHTNTRRHSRLSVPSDHAS